MIQQFCYRTKFIAVPFKGRNNSHKAKGFSQKTARSDLAKAKICHFIRFRHLKVTAMKRFKPFLDKLLRACLIPRDGNEKVQTVFRQTS
jgi:hypothetical protein